jgi:3-carboxy-cis,cis-muconate cycloisomerase
MSLPTDAGGRAAREERRRIRAEHLAKVDTADVGLLAPVSVGTFAEALTGDHQVLEAMVAFEAALSRALAEHGLAPRFGAFDADGIELRGLARDAVAPGNPTVPLVKSLRATVGDDDAEWVHHGATSQDVVDSALMLVSSAVLREMESQLVVLAHRLADLVRDHRSVPCVARTLTQQAMPTTLGFRVAGWLAGIHDAIALVRGCLPLPVSLGGPVGTLAAYGAVGPDVVASVAADLGLAAPVVTWHTRRTPVLGVATALAAVGEACGRICADLLLMSQTEVGEASDGSGGGSSAMAHKANPTRSVLVVSAVRQLPGLLATVASSGAEGSERSAGAWHAEWQPLRTMLRLAGAAVERTADVAEDVSFDPEAMSRNLGLLLAAVGKDQGWVAAQTEHVDVWVDRVLAHHEEVC